MNTPSARLRHCLLGLVFASASALAAQEPPPGPPPSGGGPGGPPPGGASLTPFTLNGAFTLADGSVQTLKDGYYTSDTRDMSAVYVRDRSRLTLINPAVSTTGGTSSQENSSFHGLNAAVLAADGGRVTVTGGSIKTTGGGANGAFATGAGSSVVLNQVKITATGDGGHGVMASAGGELALTDVDIRTEDIHAAAVATDRGGGTVKVTGGRSITTGRDSPGIYSTGDISAARATFEATGSEAAVIEGQNSITLADCILSGARKCGVMIYQSFSGDAEGRKGSFAMSGGALACTEGPLFYVTNTTGIITLAGVELSARAGILVSAAAGRWGRTGENGGHAVLTAARQTLAGDLVADAASSLSATLQDHSTLTGKVQGASLVLDATSTWIVTGDSTLAGLTLAAVSASSEGTLAGIEGNGHTVRYDATLPACRWLEGKTRPLAKGGTLTPKS